MKNILLNLDNEDGKNNNTNHHWAKEPYKRDKPNLQKIYIVILWPLKILC
jgi:hypothetical protein